METSIIGMAIICAALLIFTAQQAFKYGAECGRKTERLLGDKRVRGVLDYENARRPKSQKAKRQRARKAARLAVGSVGLVTLLGGVQ